MSGMPAGATTCFGRFTLFELDSPAAGGGCQRIGPQGTMTPAATCGEPWSVLGAPAPK